VGCHLALPIEEAPDLGAQTPDSATSSEASTTVDTTAPMEGSPTTPDGGSDQPNGMSWWNAGYAYRVPLLITEKAAGPLPAGYSVVLVLDTAALVATQQMLQSGDDLRIVRWDGSAHHEHHRRLVKPNTKSTAVWFKTEQAITGESREYYLYHGNPQAGAPPAYWSDSMGADPPSKVYLAADDFEEHGAGDCPDGWAPCDTGKHEHRWQVQGTANRVLQTTAANTYIFSGQTQWTDISMEARVWTEYPDGCPGIASRVQTQMHLVYAGYNCKNDDDPKYPYFQKDNVTVWVRPNTNGYYPLTGAQDLGVVIKPKEWHHLRVAWTSGEVRLFHDGAFAGKALTKTPDVLGAGRVGLFSTYGNLPFRADDVVVRLFVDPEPEVSVAQP
jgi:hypothetical protein